MSPFADYENFDACVRANSDKKDPKAYCAEIQREVEGKTYTFRTSSVACSETKTIEGKDYFVTGYISTGDLDLVDDIVTKACMEDMLTQLTNGSIKLDVEHEAWKRDTTIIPVGKIVDAKIDSKGIWVKALLNEHSPKFTQVWGSLKSGFLDAFSITFKTVKAISKTISGVKARLLEKVNLLNVALTGNPANPSASIIDVFMKSITDMEDKMTEEEKVEEQPKEDVAEEAPEEEAPKEEAKEEAPVEEPAEEAPEEEAPAETEEGESEEVKSLKAELKELKDEFKEFKEKPQFKAILEKPPEVPEEKAVSPLDLIK